MAQIFSFAALQLPDQTTFAGQTNPCPTVAISPAHIQQVLPASAAVIAAFPSANAVIEVSYYNGNQVYSGGYVTGSTVAQIVTAANA